MHRRFAQALAGLGVVERVEPAVAGARDAQDGMDDEADRGALAVQGGGHGIDQERHVVVDDLDDRRRRAPAIDFDARIDDAELGAAGQARLRELPQRQRRAIKVLGAALDDVGGRHAAIELLEEALHHAGARLAEPVGGERRRGRDRFVLQLLRAQGHSPDLPDMKLMRLPNCISFARRYLGDKKRRGVRKRRCLFYDRSREKGMKVERSR